MSNVSEVARTGKRVDTFEAIAKALVDSIDRAPTPSVPGLAARLVDVLKRIGGSDPSVLLWLREGLAATVDRLVEIQGEVDEKGFPLPEAAALAPTVRQLVAVVESIAGLPVEQESAKGVVTIDEAKRRRADRQSRAATQTDAGTRSRQRR